ncbi:MAG: ABC transporter permease [Oligoflexia bacterium]|nr:ABC transporter permease [Oligoflexia bacterium]
MNELLSTLKRSWRTHLWVNLSTVGVLTLCFGLIYTSLLLTANLGRLLTAWGDEVQLTLFLKDSATSEEIAALDDVLKSDPGVESVTFINKTEAKKAFEKSLSSYGPSFLKTVDGDMGNPFPASFVIKVATSYKTADRIEAIANQYSGNPIVEDSSYGQEWIKNYTSFFKGTRFVTALAVAVILAATLFVVGNAVRASLAARREEIQILELVGATSAMVRRPIILEGGLYGLLSALIALVLMGVVYQFALSRLETVSGASSVLQVLRYFSTGEILGLTLAGGLIGLIGSYLCVARINTGWAAARQLS